MGSIIRSLKRCMTPVTADHILEVHLADALARELEHEAEAEAKLVDAQHNTLLADMYRQRVARLQQRKDAA